MTPEEKRGILLEHAQDRDYHRTEKERLDMLASPSSLPEFSLDRILSEGENYRPVFGDVESPRWNIWCEPSEAWPFYIYLRKTQRHFPLEAKSAPTLEIASITGKATLHRRAPYGSGKFWLLTEALQQAFPARRLFIENVLNERFARSLWRHGWTLVGTLDRFAVKELPSFYLPPLDEAENRG